MFIGPINVNLAHHVEGNSIFFFNMSFDFFIGTRLLTSKLIARESKNGETTGFVLFVHVLKLWVMIFGVSSFRSNVYYNGNSTFICLFKVNQIPINVIGFKISEYSFLDWRNKAGRSHGECTRS